LKLSRFLAILFLTFTSLLFVPTMAKADDIIVELNSETPYIDTTVEVVARSEYIIETFTGPRFEVLADGTMAQRAGWLDSWIELRQGEQILRADDDSNHVTGVNEYASKLTGTVDAGTYTIRATSYLNVLAGQTPTGKDEPYLVIRYMKDRPDLGMKNTRAETNTKSETRNVKWLD
jgi:hypothetical protein